MHRLWHQLLRKFRLLSRREQVGLIAMTRLGLGAIGWVAWTEFAAPTPASISLTTLMEDAHKGQIQSASITQGAIKLVYRDGWEASFRGQLPDETLVQLVQSGVDVSFGGSAFTDFFNKNGFALVMLLPMLMIAWHVLGGASRFAIGGPTKLLDQTAAKYRFSDVAGQDEAKEQMTEIVDFLRDPETFTRLGAKAPQGALMVGPTGVRTPLLARALPGQTRAAFSG